MDTSVCGKLSELLRLMSELRDVRGLQRRAKGLFVFLFSRKWTRREPPERFARVREG